MGSQRWPGMSYHHLPNGGMRGKVRFLEMKRYRVLDEQMLTRMLSKA